MSRKIKVFSTETNQSKEIITSATTWAELKAEIKNAGLNADNMKGMIRETKGTLENDQAVLPTGECTIFITPQKVKSGASSPSKTIKSVKESKTRKKISFEAPKKSATKRTTRTVGRKVAPKKRTSK